MAGCKLAPQGDSELIDENGNTCVLGAALMGLGVKPDPDGYYRKSAPLEHWPELDKSVEKAVCACIGWQNLSVEGTVIHLNDNHDWTREDIATYIHDQLGY